jgi:hypothetical protein
MVGGLGGLVVASAPAVGVGHGSAMVESTALGRVAQAIEKVKHLGNGCMSCHT